MRSETVPFFRAQTIQMIVAQKIHWTRKASQGPLAAQVEVDIKVAHGQLSEVAIYRLPITAAGEIRFRYCTPVPTHLENRDHVIGILFRFQIEDHRWKSQNAKCSRGKNSAFET